MSGYQRRRRAADTLGELVDILETCRDLLTPMAEADTAKGWQRSSRAIPVCERITEVLADINGERREVVMGAEPPAWMR